MKKVAVVGCGIFGAMVALKLEEVGHEVIVYERLPEPLSGASYNNQNRLHLGFHYPRHMDTANQCKRGFNHFLAAFPECLHPLEKNGYFIASENSNVTDKDYLKFCKNLGVPFSEVKIENFPIELKNVSVGVECSELVYDVASLRQSVIKKFKDKSIKLFLNTPVENIEKFDEEIQITTKNNDKEFFDSVVNCSYSSISVLTQKLFPNDTTEYQYEYTAVAIIKIDMPNIGVTIMDGEFMTILPFGNTGDFLLYHVKHSVVERVTQRSVPDSWLDKGTAPFSNVDKAMFFQKLLADCEFFLPILKKARMVGFLEGPRMVLANKDKTDERPSLINKYSDQYMTVFSGKIDHSVMVAHDVAKMI